MPTPNEPAPAHKHKPAFQIPKLPDSELLLLLLSNLLRSIEEMKDFTNDSNKYFEGAHSFLEPPKREDLAQYSTPEQSLDRLNQLENPSDRLKTLVKAYLNIRELPTHEADWLRTTTISTFLVGGFLGALFNSRGVHDEYIRKHNASVFQNKFAGNRHFWDTLIAGMVPRALNYGFKTSLLTTSICFVCIGSVTYRGKLYAPDWFVGFTTIGALSRLWLGSRAMAAGALFGAVGSVFAYGLVRGIEVASGCTVTQIRLLHHQEWVKTREAKHMRYLESHKEYFQDKTATPDSFKFDIDG